MLSTPAQTNSPPAPIAMAPAAMWTAVIDEPQKRLTVVPAVPIGRPASSPTIRAMLKPCSASGKAQPTMMSSMSSGLALVRSTSPRTTWASRSSGRTRASAPLPAGVNGERA